MTKPFESNWKITRTRVAVGSLAFGGAGALAVWLADDKGQVLGLVLSAAAVALAGFAVYVGAQTLNEEIKSRRQDAFAQRLRRLERVGDLAADIRDASDTMDIRGWQARHASLRMTLAALGPDAAELPEAHALADLTPNHNAHDCTAASAQARAALEEAVGAVEQATS